MWRFDVLYRGRSHIQERKEKRGGWLCDFIKDFHSQLKLAKDGVKRQSKRFCYAWLWTPVFTMFYKHLSYTATSSQVICIFVLTNSFSVAEIWKNSIEKDLPKENSTEQGSEINNPLKYKVCQRRNKILCGQLIPNTHPACLHIVGVQKIFIKWKPEVWGMKIFHGQRSLRMLCTASHSTDVRHILNY